MEVKTRLEDNGFGIQSLIGLVLQIILHNYNILNWSLQFLIKKAII